MPSCYWLQPYSSVILGTGHAICRFILMMVLYNLFSVPYIVSFVASKNCGEGNLLGGVLRKLSAVCTPVLLINDLTWVKHVAS